MGAGHPRCARAGLWPLGVEPLRVSLAFRRLSIPCPSRGGARMRRMPPAHFARPAPRRSRTRCARAATAKASAVALPCASCRGRVAAPAVLPRAWPRLRTPFRLASSSQCRSPRSPVNGLSRHKRRLPASGAPPFIPRPVDGRPRCGNRSQRRAKRKGARRRGGLGPHGKLEHHDGLAQGPGDQGNPTRGRGPLQRPEGHKEC